jgi:hypothetical protein
MGMDRFDAHIDTDTAAACWAAGRAGIGESGDLG